MSLSRKSTESEIRDNPQLQNHRVRLQNHSTTNKELDNNNKPPSFRSPFTKVTKVMRSFYSADVAKKGGKE
ncbi:hypothetical protein CEXT_276451 [Caerostris extrusa]|uniref:Uncharacterized protein n=1 Tax=Caerostris extrusa TaxID=172846 RepID=A0AAV4PG75_CAEEX|nr:hypothetical protein CEXT_276451 [Caerostris extrusa]